MDHHPWRWLRDRLPDWRVEVVALSPGLVGGTDAAVRTIYLAPGMLQAQRRCVLDHEILHAEAGDLGPQPLSREAEVRAESARRLVPLDRLVEAVVWAHDVAELADECWVDVATMQCRLDTLNADERLALRRAIAIRDYHEEGL